MRPLDILLAVFMLISGTANTLIGSKQDKLGFEHPAVQTWSMFVGEFLCLFVFWIVSWYQRRNTTGYHQIQQEPATPGGGKSFPFYIFLLPASCDMTATTLMFFGLLLTYPSTYQILRGTLVVFTGILSRIFLKRPLRVYHIIGMVVITIGAGIVGVASVVYGDKTLPAKNPILGAILVIVAQVVAAVQMVLEEKLIGKYDVPPLQVVGNEGFWGFSVITTLLFITYWIPFIRERDNTLDAILQIANSWQLILTIVGVIISIAILNFTGISLTRNLSATHRTTIDASRVVFVWIGSFIFGWEGFNWLQLIGFVVLLLGTATYNEMMPFFDYSKKPVRDDM
eukprot:TRINITY_DN3836_c0_g1_i1.p1 TRINITY_DN3836_c0_g1~~TRINITY_DN3836_c0_g1_i1.p1  ORF type:complete len:350 (-),score=73.26 TRINITY_DN3836_c0_g1_i1:39-1058(-)